MLSMHTFHIRQLLFVFVVVLGLFYFIVKLQVYPIPRMGAWKISSSGDGSIGSSGSQDFQAQVESWRAIQALLALCPPNAVPPQRYGLAEAVLFDAFKGTPRGEFLKMSDGDVEKMKHAHSTFVDRLKSEPPKLHYTQNTQGIVATAGGAYLPLLIMSLRMLRNTGSKLPVEVFLASKKEYEGKICNEILPQMDAKCIILSEILDAVPHTAPIDHYKLKVFALAFSSFEHVIFLDADSFPVHDPKELLGSEPFITHGLVTWPDFWAVTASKHYYNISSQEVLPTKKRASTEAGEILVNKRTHERTLLLAMYYNYYGPEYYYPLLSQGAPGEGDKETFLAAADVLHEPYYAVSERVRAIGHRENDVLAGSAMVQYDPRVDYDLTSQSGWRVQITETLAPLNASFVHVNFPKFNPSTVFDHKEVLQHPNGTFRRAWTDRKDTIDGIKFDVEKAYWTEIKWVSCNLEKSFLDWLDHEMICEKVTKYWEAVFA